jgi:uncharacterized membrane protein
MLILRYMHILGAIALMGGTIFMRFGLSPTLVQLPDAERAKLHEQVRSFWAKFIHISIALLLISGITNLGLAAKYDFHGWPYSMVGGIKMLLALPIFAIASLLAGRGNAAKKIQANPRLWLNINLALALSMVLIGGVLRFVPRDLKSAPPAATTPAAPSEPPQS